MKKLILILILNLSCLTYYKETYKEFGVVKIYSEIPEKCSTIKGLNKKKVILSYNEKELIQNYGMTNLVYFKDGISPILYGSFYYLDFDNDIYCMALLDGKIALIEKPNKEKKNMIHQICYPLMKCPIFDEKNFIYNLMQN